MNVTSLSNFPKISVLPNSVLVNGSLLSPSKPALAVSRGLRGRDGTSTSAVPEAVYSPISPAVMSASVESVEL